MLNIKHLLDVAVAVVARATPFLSPSPVGVARGLSGFLAPAGATRRMPARAARTRRAATRTATYTVTATVYEAVAGQTDSEPFVTADNSRIKPSYGSKKRWMALSRDLLKPWGGQFAFGDKVRVRGLSPRLDGVYTVHDTMNRRHRHCMDVLVHPSEKFDLLCKGVKIQKVAPL